MDRQMTVQFSCSVVSDSATPWMAACRAALSSTPLLEFAQTDPLEKTLMLGKIEGRRRRGQQRMRWLGGITDSMDLSLDMDMRQMTIKSLNSISRSLYYLGQ